MTTSNYPYAMDYDAPSLAEIYELSETRNDDFRLLQQLMANYPKAHPWNILEPFCGTGRVLIPLLKDGHFVTGIDISENMTQMFWNKLAEYPPMVLKRVTIRCQDFFDAEDLKSFDLVVLTANALLELPSAELQKSCLERSIQALSPNGFVFIDLNNFEPSWNDIDQDEERTVLEGEVSDGRYAQMTMKPIRFDKRTGVLVVKRHYLVRRNDQIVFEHSYSAQKHLCRKDELIIWLQRLNLNIIHIYGDGNSALFKPKSPRMIFWAQKP